MLPNIQNLCIYTMSIQYKQLYRIIPEFHLIVPSSTIGFSKEPTYWNNNEQEKHLEDIPIWLDTLNPSHIIHFESTSLYNYKV